MLISQAKLGVSILLGRETPPQVVQFAQSALGKWLFLALFSAIMIFFWQRSFINYTELPMPFVILAVAACTFLPQYRWRIMGFFTAFGIFLSPFWFHPVLPYTVAAQEGAADKINFSLLRYGITIFFFISAAVFLLLIRRYRNTFLLRRPLLAMLAVFFALVLLASQNVLHGIPQVMLWSFIGVFGGYFWFLAYAVLDSRQNKPDMIHQLATFHPFWGSSIVPFGKGISFLKKMEAKDETQAAITRINGLRLLLHCVWLRGLRLIFRKVVHGYLGIPIMADAMLQQSLGTPYPTLLCWGSLIASFIEAVLKIAIWGNTVIAITRMAGFNLPPSSNKAFSARTLADFWNRYYFYFKEVLVDFFFYPTFMRCFKKHRRLRIIFATFMAACVGNVIFHFMWEIPMVAKIGLVETLTLFKTYLVYALLLSIGITISQLLPRKPETNSLRNRIFTPLGVCAFFCLIHIFDFDSTRPLQPLSVAFAFLLHLFGF